MVCLRNIFINTLHKGDNDDDDDNDDDNNNDDDDNDDNNNNNNNNNNNKQDFIQNKTRMYCISNPLRYEKNIQGGLSFAITLLCNICCVNTRAEES